MRKKRLAANTVASLLFQLTTIICGFVLPRLILTCYGSSINGLVNSITQFLSIIAFLELGVGAVVQSSLYKPLADKNSENISKIIASAQKFFRTIAGILLGYIIILVIFYPHFTSDEYSWIYTAALIVAISISSFAQYYFGVVDRLLLSADQHGYIQYNAQTVTLILNTVACVILMKAGAGIHLVKLTTSLIYLLRPAFLRIYVNKNYRIDRKIKYTGEPIKQKWNGIAQHVASVVLDGTDNIVLTVFSTLSNVSIYSVYHLVVYGVKQLFLSMTNGFQSLLGELLAKNEKENLRQTFSWFEWLLHTGTTLVFGCTGVLIVPFVSVYTAGVNDANYIQPLFAVLITCANAGHCLRLPYNVMILAAGHYKQTQSNYIIAAALNIIISVAAVIKWGLVGVALGTLAAMLYQTVWMAVYNSKNLIQGTFKSFLKQIAVDIITCIIAVLLTSRISLSANTYYAWALMAIKVVPIWLAVVLVINLIVYRNKVQRAFRALKKIKNKNGI